MNYQAGEPIPLCYWATSGGQPRSGLAVTVRVVNVQTGAELLASTAVPELAGTPGLYVYNWNGTPQARATLHVRYTVEGKQYAEFIKVDDLLDRIDDHDGRIA